LHPQRNERFRNAVLALLAAAVVMIGWTSNARAQLIQCTGLRDDDANLKVLLDDLKAEEASHGLRLHRKLKSELEMLLATLRPVLGCGLLSVIRCDRRLPEKGDFKDLGQLEYLRNRDALAEVWGDIDGPPTVTGWLRFTVIPVQLGIVKDRTDETLGIHDHEMKNGAIAVPLQSLRLWLAVSLAVRELGNGDRYRALKLLCQAEQLLDKAKARFTPAQQAAIRSYIAARMTEALANMTGGDEVRNRSLREGGVGVCEVFR